MAIDWEKWSAIGQLAGAIGTFLAVATSLYLARDSNRPKLSVNAGIRLMIEQGSQAPWPEFIVFDIRNVGLRDVYVDQISWRVGRWPFKHPRWLGRGFAVQTFGTVAESQNPPFALPQGRRAASMLRLDQTVQNIKDRGQEVFLFAKIWPVFGIRRTTIFAQVHLSSGETFTARIEKHLEQELFKAESSKFDGT